MKNKFLYLILAFAIVGFYACEDDNVGPTFSVDAPPSITAPASGLSFVLTEAEEGNPLTTIEWTAADFSPENLQNPFYRVQLDFTDDDFANPSAVGSTSDLSFAPTIGSINNLVVGKIGNLVGADTTVNVSIRVKASIENTDVDNIFSNVIDMTLTLYNSDVMVETQPIYLLGSATEAGWDNSLALEMTPQSDGTFIIIANLTSGNEIKFISSLGNWAPQWGSDGSGTWESGPLVYRPTEAEPDPMGIPSPDVDGQYVIMADTINLTYQVSSPDLIYLLGSATVAGWDNTLATPFELVEDGVYTTIAELTEGNEWKIIDDLGAWAPQWGTDGTGTWESGTLAYRPTESEPDPMAIPSPDMTGMYRIDIDLNELTYTVTPQ